MTKKYKRLTVLFGLLSFLITITPIAVYTIIGFANGDIHTSKKICLGATLIISLILVILNVLMKYRLRSPLFLMILGIHIALENMLPLLLIVSGGVVIDEFMLTPLKKKYKQKYIINKEIDKRQ